MSRLGMVRRRAVIVSIAVCVLATLIGPGADASAGNGYSWRQTWFPSGDGTMLRADVLLPEERAEDDRHPVILAIGPYFGRTTQNDMTLHSGPSMRFGDLIEGGRIFARGYAYVQVDSRGYGGSDGCSDLGGPLERSDTKAAIEWAAKQPWSTGKVGTWGKSYDGFTQVMALSENPAGLSASVIQAPLIETYRGFHMNEVPYGWYATAPIYALYDLDPTTASDPALEEFTYPLKGTAEHPDCYVENQRNAPFADRDLAYWKDRDIVDAAAASTVPTLWAVGFNDVKTKPDNFLPVYSRLRGPKRAWIGQWDHARGNESNRVGRDGFMEEAMAWFDRYLKGETVPSEPPVEVQTGEGWWRTEDSWPPADAHPWIVPLNEGTYRDVTDGSWTLGWGGLRRFGVLTFTQPAPYDVHIAGTVQVRATVAGGMSRANMVAVVYDVEPDGDATMIKRGARLIRGAGEVEFELYPQDRVLRAGHRLAVSIRSEDALYVPSNSGATVQVVTSEATVPVLRVERAANLAGSSAEAMRWVPRVWFSPSDIDRATRETSFPPPLR